MDDSDWNAGTLGPKHVRPEVGLWMCQAETTARAILGAGAYWAPAEGDQSNKNIACGSGQMAAMRACQDLKGTHSTDRGTA